MKAKAKDKFQHIDTQFHQHALEKLHRMSVNQKNVALSLVSSLGQSPFQEKDYIFPDSFIGAVFVRYKHGVYVLFQRISNSDNQIVVRVWRVGNYVKRNGRLIFDFETNNTEI